MSRTLAGTVWIALLSTVSLAACSDGSAAPDDASSVCVVDEECAAGRVCLGGACVVPVDAGGEPPVPAELVVTPAALDFGSPAIGVAVELLVTLKNVGGSSLSVTSVEVIETDALPEYTADPTGAVALELAPGAESRVRVTLSPADAEADVAVLRIVSTDPATPIRDVMLTSENKGSPVLNVAPAAIDFGVLVWGVVASEDVDVRNSGTGNAPIEIFDVAALAADGTAAAYAVTLTVIDEDSGAASPAMTPYLLAPGRLFLRAHIELDTGPLGAGPVGAHALVIATDRSAPADAERRVPLSASVLGCRAPTAETCDDTDNDCDLFVDEGDPGGGATCDSGLLGTCAAGVTACVDGALECVALAAPTAELCDGVDTNCDGVVDGGLVRTCSFGCATGVEFCVVGTWTGCNAPRPEFDLCNGVDDDCDPATVDGADDPLVGELCDGADGDLCTEGERVCTGGGLLCSDYTATLAESCNGADDDCDGVTDDGGDGLCTVAAHVASTRCAGVAGCEIARCESGWGNCDGDLANGCEADLASSAHCGACGLACGPGLLCAGATCTALTECNDGLDNDRDGAIDFPADPGCASATAATEADFTYAWESGAWSSCPLNDWDFVGIGGCSAPCGPGTQTIGYRCPTTTNSQSRAVTCRRSDGATVADASCAGVRPDSTQGCVQSSCSGGDPSYAAACTDGPCVTCPSQTISVATGSYGGSICTDRLPAYSGTAGVMTWSPRSWGDRCRGSGCLIASGCGDTPYFGTVSGGTTGVCLNYCAVRATCTAAGWTDYGYTW